MKITCPYCKKKFNVDTSLIPSEGRLLKCGSCNQEWFYKGSEASEKDNTSDEISPIQSQIKPSSLVENEQEIHIQKEIHIPKETEAIIGQAEKKIKKTRDNKEAKTIKNSKNNAISNFFFILNCIYYFIYSSYYSV